MSKKTKPKSTETQHGRDMDTFERLPEKTKNLMKLKQQHEKSTGSEQSAVTQQIRKRSRKPQS